MSCLSWRSSTWLSSADWLTLEGSSFLLPGMMDFRFDRSTFGRAWSLVVDDMLLRFGERVCERYFSLGRDVGKCLVMKWRRVGVKDECLYTRNCR